MQNLKRANSIAFTCVLITSLSLSVHASDKRISPATKTMPTNSKINFDLKVRYVDSFTAIRESEEGKIIGKELEAKRIELTKEIKEMEQKFSEAAKELQAKASTLSESGREKEQKKMVKMERKYKAMLQEGEEDMKISMQSAQERLLREHNDAVFKYAKENGIDIVFGPGGVVYASEKANCTISIIEGMNQSHKIKLARAREKKSGTMLASKDKSSANA